MDCKPVIVSACLLGLRTRHDGQDAYCDEVVKLLDGRPFIPVCPEQLGGLSTPRPKAEIAYGNGADVIEGRSRVLDEHGKDVTDAFLKGAVEALKIARLAGAAEAFMKEKSPSCGVNHIKRKGATVDGPGVASMMLKKEGLKVRGF